MLVYRKKKKKKFKKGTYNDTEYECSARLFGGQLMLNRSKDSTQSGYQHSECSFAKRNNTAILFLSHCIIQNNMFNLAINCELFHRVI